VPGNGRPEFPATGNGIGDVFEHAGIAGGGAEADFRVHHCGGDADIRGGCSQAAFRRADVRTTLEQRRTIANRNRLAQLRRVAAGNDWFRQVIRRAAEQGGNLIKRCGFFRLERRNLGTQRLDLSACASHVYFVAATAPEQPRGHVQLALLNI